MNSKICSLTNFLGPYLRQHLFHVLCGRGSIISGSIVSSGSIGGRGSIGSIGAIGGSRSS